MTDYRLGAPRTIRPPSNGIGRARANNFAGQRVPDINYPCHAVDEAGDTLCGFAGSFTTYDEPTWDADSEISRCDDCAGLAAATA
jgi:hypothetical protein